jgi:hypothetical protein
MRIFWILPAKALREDSPWEAWRADRVEHAAAAPGFPALERTGRHYKLNWNAFTGSEPIGPRIDPTGKRLPDLSPWAPRSTS